MSRINNRVHLLISSRCTAGMDLQGSEGGDPWAIESFTQGKAWKIPLIGRYRSVKSYFLVI